MKKANYLPWIIGLLTCLVGPIHAQLQPLQPARNEVTRPNYRIEGVDVGSMPTAEAAKRMRIWWEVVKLEPVHVKVAGAKGEPPLVTWGELGLALDDSATIAQIPKVLAPGVGTVYEPATVEPIFRLSSQRPIKLLEWIHHSVGLPRPAKVSFKGRMVNREPESSGVAVDDLRFFDALVKAFKEKSDVEIPIKGGVSQPLNPEWAEFPDVVASYTTRFPLSKFTRNSNIKLAAGKLNGVILKPGAILSFNGTVGKRTKQAGFKLAGVYKQGKHDVGVGGGICQVSTTLYNASLLANLRIRQRSNHSMPVAYVPLGRDATVDYGSLDLIVENSMPTPILVNSEYRPGHLTFRILGKREPGLQVKLIAGPARAWNRATRTVADPKLKPGQHKVVDKGSRGHEVVITRVVIRNGIVVKRERLGRSYYTGGDKIVAVAPTPVVVGRAVPSVTVHVQALPDRKSNPRR